MLAACSAPRALTRRARHSLVSNSPIMQWRTLKTARQSHGSHLSGDDPTMAYSTGSERVLPMKALTPSAKASTMALAPASSAS